MTSATGMKFRGLTRLMVTLMLYGILLGSFRLIAWPRETWQTVILVLLPVPELLILFGVLILIQGGSRSRFRFIGRGVTALYLGLLVAWNVGEIIYRWNYRDHFILQNDVLLLPSLLSMLTQTEWFRMFWGTLIVYFAAALLAMILGTGLLNLARKNALALQGPPTEASTNLRIASLLFVLGIAQTLAFPGETPSLRLLSGFSAGSVEEVPTSPAEAPLEIPILNPDEAAAVQATFEDLEKAPSFSFSGISDGDIHLLIVESYGHTLFTNPVHRENITPVYASVSHRLENLGWFAASGFLHSPSYGGRSWLADATLLTGRRMTDQGLFDAHIYSTESHLIGQMNAAGYRTVYAAPGTRRTPDDWKAFYGFTDYIIEGDFEWNGPTISFGNMSDQYFLDFLGRRYAESEMPVFLSALMVSSHVPFVRIPEYIEDWDRLGDGSLYHSEGIRRFNNNWLTGSEYPEGYLYSMSYVMNTILGYLERYVSSQSLVVIVGDHQPRTPISENTASYGVPIHFLSRNPRALDSLDPESFSPGFRPVDDAPLIPMEQFPRILNQIIQPQGKLAEYLNTAD